jgi:2-oxopent-4-enoate/cis-2-oxohex-4-enoate hydratase
MNKDKIDSYSEELYRALRGTQVVEPLVAREPDISIEDAYQVQLGIIRRRMERDGETVIGKKIGATSKAVQSMLGVDQPDFGHLMSGMAYNDGDVVPIEGNLIQPRMEGEIAFILKRDLLGPGITNIQDTVADNASAGLFLLGDQAVDPRRVDLKTCGMILEKNGEIVGLGAGAATLGHPLNAVAWLANTLGRRGIPLKAGEVILSGSLATMVGAKAGDHMRVTIGGMGSASVCFA